MTKYVPKFKQDYYEKFQPELKERLEYSSIMQVPRLQTICLSMGVGAAIKDKKVLESAQQELSIIAGQKAIKTKARKSIAAFKVRAGMEVGVRVQMRGDRMYDFLYRLVHVVLPRTKDFRGLNLNSFDGHGNYSLGIREHIVFPEINYDKINAITGLTIAIVTTAKTDAEARELLSMFQFPFKKV